MLPHPGRDLYEVLRDGCRVGVQLGNAIEAWQGRPHPRIRPTSVYGQGRSINASGPIGNQRYVRRLPPRARGYQPLGTGLPVQVRSLENVCSKLGC
jgi:hypothetical protein